MIIGENGHFCGCKLVATYPLEHFHYYWRLLSSLLIAKKEHSGDDDMVVSNYWNLLEQDLEFDKPLLPTEENA